MFVEDWGDNGRRGYYGVLVDKWRVMRVGCEKDLEFVAD